MELYQIRHLAPQRNCLIITRCYFLETSPGLFVNMGLSIEHDYSAPGITVRLTCYNRENHVVAFAPEAFILLRQIRDWLPLAQASLPSPLGGVKDDLELPPGSVGWLHLDAPDELLTRLPAWQSGKNSLVQAEVHTELTGLEVALRKALLLWGLRLYGKAQEWALNHTF